MIDKIKAADEAVALIQDGVSIMVGGFMACGTPEIHGRSYGSSGRSKKGHRGDAAHPEGQA